MLALSCWAGPVEFGREELRAAFASRGMNFDRLRIRIELDQGAPETYRIERGRITGGDLRGLMYGLLEAARQIRTSGRLLSAVGAPAVSIRGVRMFLHNQEFEKRWFYSEEYWKSYFRMLARNRFNRFNLVFAHQTNYLAPPYPFWVGLKEFPEVRAPGLSELERDNNLRALRFISNTAAEYGIDFTLGVWEHNIQPGMRSMVEGLTPDNIGPYSYRALKAILAACPAIRSVQMRTNSESGIPKERQVEFYRDWVFRAIRETGRRVTLDLRGWAMQEGMMDAALGAGVPLRLSAKYWAEHLGRPYQPAETWPGYSYIDFLRRPRRYDFYWEVWALGSNRLLLWGDPEYVRRAAPTFTLCGSSGFEIDAPLAQKGFGNGPGEPGVFSAAKKDLEWWQWEFERYWLFYMLWGRLTYAPNTPGEIWLAELKQRFGPAAPDVLDAYRHASRILPEIVAAHLGDPNMYIWPEINPGGLIDSYMRVRPSDWRFIASIPEAVHNRLEHIASAKQTPEETAALLNQYAFDVLAAIDRARGKISPDNREWRASEPDFLALARLARYHAHKQIAAEQLAEFDAVGGDAPLANARRELEAAVREWQALVQVTGGLYPPDMAFGPDEVGHWKDKIPYVLHDLELLREREDVWKRFGAFTRGFDFGGPIGQPHGPAYRNDEFVTRYMVAPRFEPVDPATAYTDERGFGWAADGLRAAEALPSTPYFEIRAIAPNPQHLPRNVLFGDSIRGQGPQLFRVRASGSKYAAQLLHPDGSAEQAVARLHDGVLDIVMPDGEWRIAGVVINGSAPRRAMPPAPALARRPAIVHSPPAMARSGAPLELTLRLSPAAGIAHVRLHYRAVDQTAKFIVLELPAAPVVKFTIPGEDAPSAFDLMYYFEILGENGRGWFSPDPLVERPYHIVSTMQP
jgi:hypothetical protein